MDKNQTMIDFIMTCPILQNNPLFFNFAESGDGNNHFITETDKATRKPYIDGSQEKEYTFTLASYKSISHNAIIEGAPNENIEEMAEVQSILDWIEEQNDLRNFPDFGDAIEVEMMSPITTDPEFDGIDTSVNPPIVRYSIGVVVTYLDNTKKLWNS